MPSAGSAQAHNPIAEAFSGEPPEDGEPAAIYRAGRPSGVIVLIPGDFRGRLAPLGEGLVTNKGTSQGVATSSLSFRVEPRKPSTTELGPAALTLACNANVLTNPSWEPGVDVVWGAQQGRGRVWKGTGKYGGGNETRLAYVLWTVVGDREVTGCGAWNATNPELEGRVIAILKSVRLGVAPPADLYGN
jgi:hypothetical protein